MKTAFKQFLLWGTSLLPARSKETNQDRGGIWVEAPGTAANPAPFNAPVPPIAVTFSGTVVRSGSRFVLREKCGVEYPLDSIGRAWTFEGEDVRIVGTLDEQTHTLHVDNIESLAA